MPGRAGDGPGLEASPGPGAPLPVPPMVVMERRRFHRARGEPCPVPVKEVCVHARSPRPATRFVRWSAFIGVAGTTSRGAGADKFAFMTTF
ncbi:MAG: hypothetical protein GY899_12435 [Verrucomicrobiaceae bacterium]|nr:hypothetical protein [Verrucomicrobiaceae bacterium]